MKLHDAPIDPPMKFTKVRVKKYRVTEKKVLSKAYLFTIDGKDAEKCELAVSWREEIWLFYQDQGLYSDHMYGRFTSIADRSVLGNVEIKDFTSDGIMAKKMIASLHGSTYVLQREKTEKSLFDLSSWGTFKFILSLDGASATYSFRIAQSVLDAVAVQNPYINRPFEGDIEVNGLSNFDILFGLALIEKALFRYGQNGNLLSST